MKNYVSLSLETHLFFARIMKEHGLFLQAGFVCADATWAERADWFRKQFEELLSDAVRIASGRVNREVLQSQELVTAFTILAEERTAQLSGIPIDSGISEREQEIRSSGQGRADREQVRRIEKLNRRALQLLDEFIFFKESILKAVMRCALFHANYPLLIEHILREARLYRTTVQELLEDREISSRDLRETEEFWNRIMMEHALFIRGLLDPTENALIAAADQFAAEYKELLEKAREQDCKALGMSEASLKETLRFSQFKEAGTNGILRCEIASIILPLLADHVLREANHYIRLLETGSQGREG